MWTLIKIDHPTFGLLHLSRCGTGVDQFLIEITPPEAGEPTQMWMTVEDARAFARALGREVGIAV